ncbi:hypothetical protein TNCV_427961 [Trichonephila clavipes]|nr:hypothetical protein TNCV_427961 [Trichonephila clavipes]
MLRHNMKDRGLVMVRVDHIRENPKDLGKPRVRRVPNINWIQGSASHLQKGADKEQVSSMTGTGRPGQLRAKETVAERRPVRSKQATAVKPCPYYLRSRVKQLEGIPEEQWNRLYPAEQHQEKEPQHGSLRRRSGG